MKNKSKLMKLLITVFVFLILVLLLVIIFLVKRISNLKLDNSKPKVQVVTKKYVVKNYEDIVFDFRNANVKFELTDSEKLIIKQKGKTGMYLINVSSNKNKLNIKEKQTNYFLKTKFTVYIPRIYEEKIDVINAFSNIEICSLENELEINNNAGNIKLKDINDVTVENVSGTIRINKVFENIDFNSSTGDLIINSLTGKCNITTITGDVKISNFEILSNSFFETTSGDINIKVDKNSICKLKVKNQSGKNKINKKKCNSKDNLLEIKNITGNVNID